MILACPKILYAPNTSTSKVSWKTVISYITDIVIWQTSKVIFLTSYFSYFRQKLQLSLAPAKMAVS